MQNKKEILKKIQFSSEVVNSYFDKEVTEILPPFIAMIREIMEMKKTDVLTAFIYTTMTTLYKDSEDNQLLFQAAAYEIYNEKITRSKAIQWMKLGHKITHDLFDPGEFIYMRYGEIFDEKNNKMRGANFDFWTDRKGPQWDDGYRLYNEIIVN